MFPNLAEDLVVVQCVLLAQLHWHCKIRQNIASNSSEIYYRVFHSSKSIFIDAINIHLQDHPRQACRIYEALYTVKFIAQWAKNRNFTLTLMEFQLFMLNLEINLLGNCGGQHNENIIPVCGSCEKAKFHTLGSLRIRLKIRL